MVWVLDVDKKPDRITNVTDRRKVAFLHFGVKIQVPNTVYPR